MVPFLPFIKAIFFTFTSYDLFNRQIVFMCKFPVTFIMRRGTHYGTSTIVYQYIVCNPYRNLFARHWVYCIRARKHTFFRRFCRCTINIAHITHTCNESFQFSFIRRIFNKAFHIWMFRCQYYIAYAINSINPCSIHRYAFIDGWHFKGEFCTFRTANPVLLHQFNALWPMIKSVQIS